MDRQALIDAVLEATIDYVMTNVKNGRSVGPAWIRYQNREVNEAFDPNKRQMIDVRKSGLKPKWKMNKFDPAKRQLLKPIKRKEIKEALEATLKAKLKKPRVYSKHVRSKSELMDKIGKKTTDRFGHKTLHLPGHRVFLTRFKNPRRLPENIGE